MNLETVKQRMEALASDLMRVAQNVPTPVHNAICHAIGAHIEQIPYTMIGALSVFVAGFRLVTQSPDFTPDAERMALMPTSVAPDETMIAAALACCNTPEIRALARVDMPPDAEDRYVDTLLGAALMRLGGEVLATLQLQARVSAGAVPFMAPASRYSH